MFHADFFLKKTNKPAARAEKAAALLLGVFFAVLAGEAAMRLGGVANSFARERRASVKLLANPGAYRIMCLGESMTATGGESAWPARLERLLNEKYPGTGFTVVNKALGGSDISRLMSDLEKNLDEVKPDMVITMMGINDGSIYYYEGVSGSGTWLFRHSRLYRWFRLALNPRVVLRKEVPSIPPLRKTPGQADPYGEIIGHGIPPPGTEGRLRENLRGKNGDPLAIYLLGKYLVDLTIRGSRDPVKGPEGEALLLRAAALTPDKSYVYLALGLYYQAIGDDAKGLPMMERAAQLSREIDNWYWLANYYLSKDRPKDAERAVLNALDFDNLYDDALFLLVRLRTAKGDYSGVEDLLLGGVSAAPENEKILEALISFYRTRGQKAAAERYAQELDRKRAFLTERTRGYYTKLGSILAQRGIRLVCLQYPMTPLAPLRALLPEIPGTIFVDNEDVFKKAVAKKGSDYYFYDLFGGNFGHFTDEGHELLARNVLDAVFRDFSPGRKTAVSEAGR